MYWDGGGRQSFSWPGSGRTARAKIRKTQENACFSLLSQVIPRSGGGEGARLFAEEALSLFCRAFEIAETGVLKTRLGAEVDTDEFGRWEYVATGWSSKGLLLTL